MTVPATPLFTLPLRRPRPGWLRLARGNLALALQRWRRERDAAHTRQSLARLDDRTLRDLGFDRSEIPSLAAELGDPGRVERQRVLQALNGGL